MAAKGDWFVPSALHRPPYPWASSSGTAAAFERAKMRR